VYAGFLMLIEKLDSSHATMKTTAEGAMAPHSRNMQAWPSGLNKQVGVVAITARRFVQGFVNCLQPVTRMISSSRIGSSAVDVLDLNGARVRSSCAPLSSFCLRDSAPSTGSRINSRAAHGRLSFTPYR